MTSIALVLRGVVLVGCAGFMVLGTGGGLFVLADQQATEGSRSSPMETKTKVRNGLQKRNRR